MRECVPACLCVRRVPVPVRTCAEWSGCLKALWGEISQRGGGNNKCNKFLLGWIGPGPDWSGLLCLAGLVCTATRAGTESGEGGGVTGCWDGERSGLRVDGSDLRCMDDLID